MIPRLKADLGLREIAAALAFWQKDAISRFEQNFAELMGQQHAVAFPYGRTGLLALLKSLKLQGKEIICPAYTCVVVQHAIVTAGFTPVMVDSQDSDFNMDWGLVETASNENTSAVIATSIFGLPVDLDAIDEYKKRHPNVRIIQDCAHSFAAEWQGRPVQQAGDAAIFGLNISKVMTSIYGGMVTTDDPALANALKATRQEILTPARPGKTIARLLYLIATIIAFWRPVYGLVNRLERSGLLDRFVKYYDESIIDMPTDYLEQITELEARVGIAQCRKYPKIISHRQKLAQIYFATLKEAEGLRLPPNISGATYSHFVIRSSNAKQLIQKALAKGIQLGELIDYDVSEMSSYKTYPYFGDKKAKAWPDNVINLPVHRDCSEKDARKIAAMLLE